ncbi:MAG: exodeoxyribonuclease VII large subunit [Bacteroides sp.]|nr:exodeoxyribonuclease VII large subunit [Bacteroides sp.]MCM1085496.1 exodeoxyribonuclease VII large subunit [Bacteroides sp.]
MMPDGFDVHVFSLLDVCKSIQRTLTARYGSPFWVKAELHKLNFYPGSGHCFPELLQKENGQTVAQMRATLWNGDYRRINERFLQTVREPLKDGIEILFSASVQYDPRYGLGLHIHDIDPDYVLGSLERERLQCLKRLAEEGLLERNKGLDLPLVPAKIAVISAQTSKGFSDFMQVLERNGCGYSFYVRLFPALLQGDKAVDSIREALRTIREFPIDFDMVMIIRGGGDEVGLSAYNRYELAHDICLYPIPVLTGIGHSTNLTVSEEVAWFHGITPTELAVFVLSRFEAFEQELTEAAQRLQSLAQARLERERQRLAQVGNLLRLPGLKLRYRRENLRELQIRLQRAALKLVRNRKEELTQMEKTLHRASPERTLKMGYSLTYQGGRLIRKATDVQVGQSLRTLLAEGEVISRVQETKND